MTPESLNSGINAGIVPGNFGGYLAALERFGTMSLADMLAAAIDYAEHGYPIDPSLATAIARAQAQPREVSDHARRCSCRAAQPPAAGELFKNRRSRGDAEEGGGGRAGGAEAEEVARAGDPGRRSIASTRATSRRSSIASSRSKAA